jgi:mono/diheme cytochrome c family protein
MRSRFVKSRRSMAALIALLIVFVTTHAAAAQDEPPAFSPPGNFIFALQFAEKDGATLYRAVCQGCHMADAKGAEGAGRYPALAANPKLASANYAALTVLKGRHAMPAFGFLMVDAQVAEIVNYVRTHFDNHYNDALTADDIKKLR